MIPAAQLGGKLVPTQNKMATSGIARLFEPGGQIASRVGEAKENGAKARDGEAREPSMPHGGE